MIAVPMSHDRIVAELRSGGMGVIYITSVAFGL